MGAEIGVWRGYLSSVLLCRPDVVLFMVDSWLGIEGFGEQYSPKVQPECKEAAVTNTKYAGRRAQILHMDSKDASERIKDKTLDFVFIDADHSYEGCRKDIEYWLPKVRLGGLIGGHDYNNPRFDFGKEVKKAVDEAAQRNHWTLDLGRNTTWFAHV